jgi:hypothetical protein
MNETSKQFKSMTKDGNIICRRDKWIQRNMLRKETKKSWEIETRIQKIGLFVNDSEEGSSIQMKAKERYREMH